jgi:hypothetical protein
VSANNSSIRASLGHVAIAVSPSKAWTQRSVLAAKPPTLTDTYTRSETFPYESLAD